MIIKRKIENLLYRMGLLSETYIFERNLKLIEELDYDEVQVIWRRREHQVHGSLDDNDMECYARHIMEGLKVDKNDRILSIGCGDGRVDKYILPEVSKLYGFDFADTKIEEACKRNKNMLSLGGYYQHSFLDEYNTEWIVNKMYSFGVMQYCRPEDVDIFFARQKAICNSNIEYAIGHFDVPDIDKAASYYYNYCRVPEEVINKHRKELRTIFSDGSYWHDMNYIKECLESQGAYDIQIKNSPCFYRSDIIFKIKGSM